MTYDFIVVGAGLSGAVVAERIASSLGKRVLVVDKRDHIGGNCFDYIDKETGILMNRYGAHIFHTEHEDVWAYIQQFSDWKRWDHKVIASIDDKLVPLPVNINTINSLFDANLKDADDMKKWIEKETCEYDNNNSALTEYANSEELALRKVGRRIYEKLFKEYTFKQWDKYPSELDTSILARIPIRHNFDDRYFSDKYQALPAKGYTKFFDNLFASQSALITVQTHTDFFEVREALFRENPCCKVIYTGPIDRYFESSGLPRLEYRSIDFHIQRIKNIEFGYSQPNSVVNYPGNEVPYTRIVEYKHFLQQASPHTVIVSETTSSDGDPYYPVVNKKNMELYEQYRTLAEQEENENGVYFLGRLASYKYWNMDQAIKNALDFFEKHKNEWIHY